MSTLLERFDVIRVTFVCSLGPQVSMTRFHYQVGIITGAPTDQQAATQFDASQAGFIKPLIANPSTYRGFSVQVLRPAPTPGAATHFQVFQRAIGKLTAGNGTGGAAPLPPQTRGIVSLKGAVAARGLNCRFYMPFPTTTMIGTDAFTPSATYQSNLSLLAGNFVTLSSIDDGLGNIAPIDLIDFLFDTPSQYNREFLTDWLVQPKWATQRRSGAYGRSNIPPF